MSTRNDIIDGSLASSSRKGLVYTKKCGWIDLGHARPDNARDLWHNINHENTCPEMRGTTPIKPDNLSDWFVVKFVETMAAYKIKIGVVDYFAIKKRLPCDIKLGVALGIFMNVSTAFERLQAAWPITTVTDSGFSVEDLVSNLIGFYRAVNPTIDYLSLCEPVSAKEAFEIWDTYGPVGSHKNHSPSPVLFSLLTEKRDCMQTHPKPVSGKLPSFLNTIRPNFSPENVVQYRFMRNGNLVGVR